MTEKDPSGTPSPAADEAYLAALRGTPVAGAGSDGVQPVPSAQLSMSGASAAQPTAPPPAAPPGPAGPGPGGSAAGHGSTQLPKAAPAPASSEIGPMTPGSMAPPPAQYAPPAGPPPGAAGALPIPPGATLPAPSAGTMHAATPPVGGSAPAPTAVGLPPMISTAPPTAGGPPPGVPGPLAPINAPAGPEARGLGVPFTGTGMADGAGGVALLTAPVAAPPGAEWITCPECGLRTAIDPAQRRSEDFCKRCDYPLFWARAAVVPLSGEETGASLRRLPGTVGRAATASVPCPHCNEPNSPTALICIRCGRSMLPDPEPEPEPEPVYVAPPPAPEPEPEKGFPLWWVVVMCVCLLIITILVAWVALS